jgi:hypothetical protein
MENQAEYSIEQRVDSTLAIRRYLKAADRFNEASRDFTTACKTLRKQLGSNERFVVQIDWKHYLVTTDGEANFDVEPIQSL